MPLNINEYLRATVEWPAYTMAEIIELPLDVKKMLLATLPRTPLMDLLVFYSACDVACIWVGTHTCWEIWTHPFEDNMLDGWRDWFVCDVLGLSFADPDSGATHLSQSQSLEGFEQLWRRVHVLKKEAYADWTALADRPDAHLFNRQRSAAFGIYRLWYSFEHALRQEVGDQQLRHQQGASNVSV